MCLDNKCSNNCGNAEKQSLPITLNGENQFCCRYYINYKLMKKKVKQYANQSQAVTLDRRYVLKDFSRMLDNQVRRWD